MKSTPYTVLDLPNGCKDKSLINKAYRKLSRKHHPDLGGDIDIYIKVQEAYDVLTGKLDISKSSFSTQGIAVIEDTSTIYHINLFTIKYKKE